MTGTESSFRKGSDAIHKEDGSINTGFIPGWHDLSKSDKDIVTSERKRLGIKFKPKGGTNKSWR